MKINTHNEALKGDRKFALAVNKTYRGVLKELSWKATNGDNKAARLLMEKMAEQNVVLYNLGFYLTDSGRLKKR